MAVARRFSSSRPHGRHFLRSRRLVEALVADAGVGAGDLVLDLGAGEGALTASCRGGRVASGRSSSMTRSPTGCGVASPGRT
ncbi:MAG TPA: hypothetical protein VF101_12710 [Gaiellaceae bacterium]